MNLTLRHWVQQTDSDINGNRFTQLFLLTPTSVAATATLWIWQKVKDSDPAEYTRREIAYLTDVHVDRAYRRQGFATHLLEEAATRAQTEDCTAIYLLVKRDNASAIACYEAAGYRKSAEWDSSSEFGMTCFFPSQEKTPSQ